MKKKESGGWRLQSLLSHYFLSGQLMKQEAEQEWYQTSHGTVLILPHRQVMFSDLDELAELSSYLVKNGEQGVALPLKNKENQWITEMGEQRVVAFLLSDRILEQSLEKGHVLATFHNKSHHFQLMNRGESSIQWPDFWFQRIDQLHEWYAETLQREEAPTSYEELLLLSYPYIIGRAGNAIQYIIDVLRDRHVSEALTVCHHRLDVDLMHLGFSPRWVIDHPARDIAEWIRAQIIKNGEKKATQEMDRFIEAYQALRPLSQEAYALIYGRLLFPSDYFDHIDQWTTEKDASVSALSELKAVIDNVLKQERFLRSFAQKYMENLPVIEWLS